MINLFKNFFNDNIKSDDNNTIDNLQILCGLMIEAANTDGNIDEKEISKIKSILIDTFDENIENVNFYLERAINEKNNAKSLYFYTSKINKEFSSDKKILLLETMWEIILSDGKIHEYESSILRRLSGLLYISDIDSGNARKRALNKIDKLK